MRNIKIVRNPKHDMFEVHVDMYSTEFLDQFHSKQYNHTQKCWFLPKVRRNMETLGKLIDSSGLKVDAESLAEIRAFKPIGINRVPFPNNQPFLLKPYEYQMKTLDAMYGLDVGCLVMWMGTGKTKVALELMNAKNAEVIVVLCPVSVIPEWVKDINKHLGKKYTVVLSKKYKGAPFKGKTIFIVGTQSLSRKSKCFEKLKKIVNTYSYVTILDEAHMIKTPSSNRSKHILELTKNCKLKYTLTGTPVTKNLEDLYNIFEFLDPRIIGLGNFAAFKKRYCRYENKQMGYGRSFNVLVGYKNQEELLSLIRPFCYVLKDSSDLKLPSKVYMTREVEMSSAQRQVYLEHKKKRSAFIKEYQTGTNNQAFAGACTENTIMVNICCGYIKEGNTIISLQGEKNNPKLHVLQEIIDGLPEEDEQMIIWVKRKHEVTCISDYLEGKYSYVEFHGDVPQKQRNENKDLFFTGKSRFFIATPDCGAVGIDLTNCRYVVYFSTSGNYMQRIQSEERCHRNGQKRSVTYIDLCYKDSLEEKILSSLEAKEDFNTKFMSDLKGLKNVRDIDILLK